MPRRIITTLLIGISLIVVALLLYFRFQISMIRFFDSDEFGHMYRAYQLASGLTIYKDFGYYYPPVFAGLISPFFVNENISAIFLSRSLMFFIFSLNCFLAYFIGKENNRFSAVLSALFIAGLPVILDKTLEIRPDNLALLLWLASFFFLLKWQKTLKTTFLVLTGICGGLSVCVITKSIFFYPGILATIIFSSKKINHQSIRLLLRRLVKFHLAAVIPLLFLFLSFVFQGNLSSAVYSIFILPVEVFRTYGTTYFVPFYPFSRVDAFYGLGGTSLPWIASNAILIIGLLGLIKSRPRSFYLVSLLSLCVSVFFVFRLTLIQYYLPLFFLLALSSAQALGRLSDLIYRHSLPIFSLFWLSLVALVSFSFWQTAQIHFNWINTGQINTIQTLLSVSLPTDYFFDAYGYHLFRPNGYYYCCEFYGDWQRYASRPLPSFETLMETRQTKYIYYNDHLGRLPPEDQEYINTHFAPSGINNLLIRKP